MARWLVGAGLVVCIAALGWGGWSAWRAEKLRAECAVSVAEAAKQEASSLAAALAQRDTAEAARDAAQKALEAMALDLEQARATRTKAEKELFDAFDRDADLAGPGIPERVRAEIRAHWAGQ
ncbi:hypothetical protein [Rhodobacter lacus]|uniref:Uncharacterized protein n=1 Tax=Rhodobacter lacus TaxID=1641972 RepID=A0ABW5ADL0_9RHOB